MTTLRNKTREKKISKSQRGMIIITSDSLTIKTSLSEGEKKNDDKGKRKGICTVHI